MDLAKRGRLAYQRLAKLKELVNDLLAVFEVKCYFCGESLADANLFEITTHHINEIHEDDRPENKAFSHRACHKSHHAHRILHNQPISALVS